MQVRIEPQAAAADIQVIKDGLLKFNVSYVGLPNEQACKSFFAVAAANFSRCRVTFTGTPKREGFLRQPPRITLRTAVFFPRAVPAR